MISPWPSDTIYVQNMCRSSSLPHDSRAYLKITVHTQQGIAFHSSHSDGTLSYPPPIARTGSITMRAVNRSMITITSIRSLIPTASQLSPITCLKHGGPYSSRKKNTILIARNGSAAKVNSIPWYPATVRYVRDLTASIAIKPQKVVNVMTRTTDPTIPQARISIHLPTMTATKLINIGKRKK